MNSSSSANQTGLGKPPSSRHRSTDALFKLTAAQPSQGVYRYWGRLAVLVAALLMLGLAWALASPVGASPDDDFHLASIWCSATAPEDTCVPGQDSLAEGFRSVFVPVGISPAQLCYVFNPSVSGACGVAPRDTTLSASRANDGLYPGGYYVAMGLLVTEATSRSVLAMRLAAWILSIACIAGAVAVSPRQLRSAYITAAIATSVPLGVFIMASNNPSGVAVAGIGAYWCSSMAFMTTKKTRQRFAAAIVAVISATFALSSRADAGLFIAAATLTVLLQSRAWHRNSRARALLLGVIGLLGLFGIFLGTQTAGAARGLGDDTGRSALSTLSSNVVQLPSLWLGSLGTWGLGWLDTIMPTVVWFGTLSVVAGLVFWSLSFSRSRVDLAATLLMMSTIVIFPLYVLQQSGNLVGENVQPRYLLPALPIILATLLLAVPQGPSKTMARAQRNFMLALLIIANSVALHTNIARYITGVDVRDPFLRNPEWWWNIPLSPLAVWALGSVAFACCAIIGLHLSDTNRPLRPKFAANTKQ